MRTHIKLKLKLSYQLRLVEIILSILEEDCASLQYSYYFYPKDALTKITKGCTEASEPGTGGSGLHLFNNIAYFTIFN